MRNPKVLLALLLLGAGLLVGWDELVVNFYGKPLDATTFQAPSNGYVPQYVSATGKWTAQTITVSGTSTVQESDVTVDAAAATLDFAGANFDVTSSPSGEANVFLATDGVTASSIAASAVGASEVADGTLTTTDLSASAGVVYTQLAFSNNIVAADIATGAVASAEILDGTITGGTAGAGVDIAANTITADNIATGGVATDEILDGTITGGTAGAGVDIAANTITAANIATGGVATDEILDSTIVLGDLAAALQSAAQGTESTRKISTSAAAALGTAAAAGSSVEAAAGDHVHAAPSLTANNSAHGATTTMNVSAGYSLTSSTSGGTTNVTLSSFIAAGGYLSRPSNNVNLFYLPDVSDRVSCLENGTWIEKRIPAAGLTVAGTGLSNSTVYYAYVADLASSDNILDSLVLSTTAPVTVSTTENPGGVYVMGMTNTLARNLLIARCRTNASGAIVTYVQDTSRNFICNEFNRRSVPLFISPSVDSFTYQSTSYDSFDTAGGGVANRVEWYASGKDSVVANSTVVTQGNASLESAVAGIDLDGTNGNDAQSFSRGPNLSGLIVASEANYVGNPAEGYRFLQMTVRCTAAVAAVTIYGDGGVTFLQSGMTATVMQ